MISLSDPRYQRAPARTLQVGDQVPLERVATGELYEKTVLHVEARGTRVAVRYEDGTVHFLPGGQPIYRRDGVIVERCLHAPYYGEWVLRRGEVVFGSAPGWLSQDEADARLRAAHAVIEKVSG